jgi:hypothetical protein
VGRANQLVELELDRSAFAILGVLDEENHEEGDDRRGCVDDELPRVTECENRPTDDPDEDDEPRDSECDGVTRELRDRFREPVEQRAAVHA